jgi:hypothetical protein
MQQKRIQLKLLGVNECCGNSCLLNESCQALLNAMRRAIEEIIAGATKSDETDIRDWSLWLDGVRLVKHD